MLKSNIIAILMLSALSTDSLASFNVSLSGSTSKSAFGLESHERSNVSASFAVGLARFVRLGLTHRRSFEKKKGLRRQRLSDERTIYYEFVDDTEVLTSSIDLTVILYHGQVSPFIFGGAARRDYFSETVNPFESNKFSIENDIVPNYGLGLSIMLSREFSLKLTQTYTEGEKIELSPIGEEIKSKTTDSFSQIGISYRFQ